MFFSKIIRKLEIIIKKKFMATKQPPLHLMLMDILSMVINCPNFSWTSSIVLMKIFMSAVCFLGVFFHPILYLQFCVIFSRHKTCEPGIPVVFYFHILWFTSAEIMLNQQRVNLGLGLKRVKGGISLECSDKKNK